MKNSKFHPLIKCTLSLLGPAWTYTFGVRFGVRFEETPALLRRMGLVPLAAMFAK